MNNQTETRGQPARSRLALVEPLPGDARDWKGDYFGNCPECIAEGHRWGNDGYLNVHKTHVFVCHRHKLSWSVGINLFSSSRRETEDVWRANAELLSDYREVEPVDGHAGDER